MGMHLAIVPARGGSKRIPGKNIRPFLGKPIIAYPVAAALGSGLFTHVVVSTDSEDIAAVARQYGAEVPFMRPTELANDHVPTVDVLLHALTFAENAWGEVSTLCCLYPTAAFVTPELIRKGLTSLSHNKATAAITVARYGSPILRALSIDNNGNLSMMWPEYELTRTQDLPAAYYDAGQMYWVYAEALRQEKRIYTKCSVPIVLSDECVQDIDSEADWQLAELKYDLLGRKNGSTGSPMSPDRST